MPHGGYEGQRSKRVEDIEMKTQNTAVGALGEREARLTGTRTAHDSPVGVPVPSARMGDKAASSGCILIAN